MSRRLGVRDPVSISSAAAVLLSPATERSTSEAKPEVGSEAAALDGASSESYR